MDAKKLIPIILFIMGLFIFASLALVSVGIDWTTDNDFCKDCHKDESGLYNKPGTSLDYLHNINNIKCIDCHRNTGWSKVSNPSKDLKTTLIFDVLGTHPVLGESTANAADIAGGNAYEGAIDNNRYCLECHPDYVQRVEDRLISPHEQNTECTNCHTGHSRTDDSEVCSECHSRPYDTLQEEGGKHSKNECGFCHTQHGYIPACQTCHSLFHGGSEELIQCQTCHINAHSPRNVKLDVYEKDAVNDTESEPYDGKIICAKCHASPKRTFETTPTKHAKIACTMCHQSHGEKPQCINCHESHDESIKAKDCMNCHMNPHAPTRVKYPQTTSREFCANCHDAVAQILADSNTKHAQLQCAQCHPVHGEVPTCIACHRTPHGPSVTDCGISCHMSAHDVWRVK